MRKCIRSYYRCSLYCPKCIQGSLAYSLYIRCEITLASVGGEKQISIRGGGCHFTEDLY